jgi:hypothetical protein
MTDVDLNGEWVAIDARMTSQAFHVLDFDDSSWQKTQVPSHWSEHVELAECSSVCYRRRFEYSPRPQQRSWLQFEGVFTHASVWVDGSYHGEIDNYFAPRAFEITSDIAQGSEHVVAAEVTSPSFDAPWSSPGGIWKPVSVHHSGAVHISRKRVLCTEAREERGVLTCYLELDAIKGCEVRIRTVISPLLGRHAGTDHEVTRKLAAGANRVSWQVSIDQPDLWWPWGLGPQNFSDVAIEVIDSESPEQVSDSIHLRTAFRQVSFDDGFTYVNGEQLFLQSVEAGNDGTPPRDTDHAYFTELIEKRRDAGANLLVRSRWIEPAAFYDVADELGMLVWQGVPSVDGRPPHGRHARQMVEVLGHRPSIALWLRPQKRLIQRRPAPDALKRAIDKTDSSRTSIEAPLGWDMHHLTARDVLAVAPKWAKRSRFLHFTSDPREAPAHIDALRLLKYRPLGGYLAPLALPELLDGAGDAVRITAIAKEQAAFESPLDVDVFVINDTRKAIDDATVAAHFGHQTWAWAGNVGADATSFIGTISLSPPPDADAVEVGLKMSGAHQCEHKVRIPVRRSKS